ncbi:glycosyltransferase family 4 protein [Clostridium bornimense]|uniref:glycosyltransferase family 4 protein n=1 Tax=Clostridium bornimense TaxID=1216932 RepID=UPI001C11CDAB|nr:glycosyltransferase family 4 protein [Clostridium bornimense]MBU5315361.1 glycosyltransferase family 4 protein [Clostridium bornimense]
MENLNDIKDNMFLFDINEGKKIIKENRIYTEELIKKIDNCANNIDIEGVANLSLQYADYVQYKATGEYCNEDIEKALLICGKNIDMDKNNFQDVELMLENYTTSKRKILHVISEGYKIGGHTKLVKNWIKKDEDSISALITTWQMNTLPEELIEEVKNHGGFVYSLNNFYGTYEKSASLLRKIAYSWSDIVILHCHMQDPIPILAFAVEGGPPVFILNHADHRFWIGSSIADVIVDCREESKKLSFERRGARESFILPVPLSEKGDFDKEKYRDKYGIDRKTKVILTIAEEYKFKSINQYSYIDILKRIIFETNDTIAYIVGPKREGKWEQLCLDTNERVKVIGRTENIEELYMISDMYLDSFMFSSFTALLDAAMYGLQIIKFKNHVAPLFSDTGEEIEQCCFNNVDEAINYINNEFNSNKKNVQLEIRKKHCSDIPKKIEELYSKIKNHTVNENIKINNNIGNNDLFWALFLKQ